MKKFLNENIIFDVIFFIQITFGIWFGLAQFFALLHSTKGMSVAMVFFTWLFVTVNWTLVIQSKNQENHSTGSWSSKDRKSKQMFWTYFLGVVIYFSWLMEIILIDGLSAWSVFDIQASSVVLVGSITIAFVIWIKGISYFHPYVRAAFAGVIRVVPHFFLGLKILDEGAAGISIFALWIFHILTGSRLLQACFIPGDEKNKKVKRGLIISESLNEISWIYVTTIVYI